MRTDKEKTKQKEKKRPTDKEMMKTNGRRKEGEDEIDHVMRR